MTGLPPCLPLAPTIRRRDIVEVVHTVQRQADGLWHQHISYYDADTGEAVLTDLCSVAGDEDR